MKDEASADGGHQDALSPGEIHRTKRDRFARRSSDEKYLTASGDHA